MCSCHSIPECCVMFSGVKLSMGSFVVFCPFKGMRSPVTTVIDKLQCFIKVISFTILSVYGIIHQWMKRSFSLKCLSNWNSMSKLN